MLPFSLLGSRCPDTYSPLLSWCDGNHVCAIGWLPLVIPIHCLLDNWGSSSYAWQTPHHHHHCCCCCCLHSDWNQEVASSPPWNGNAVVSSNVTSLRHDCCKWHNTTGFCPSPHLLASRLIILNKFAPEQQQLLTHRRQRKDNVHCSPCSPCCCCSSLAATQTLVVLSPLRSKNWQDLQRWLLQNGNKWEFSNKKKRKWGGRRRKQQQTTINNGRSSASLHQRRCKILNHCSERPHTNETTAEAARERERTKNARQQTRTSIQDDGEKNHPSKLMEKNSAIHLSIHWWLRKNSSNPSNVMDNNLYFQSKMWWRKSHPSIQNYGENLINSSIHPPWCRKKSSIYLTWWTTTYLSTQCEGEKLIHLSNVMEKILIHRSNVMEKFFHPMYQSVFSKREWRKSHPSSQHEGENFIHLSTVKSSFWINMWGRGAARSQQQPYLGEEEKQDPSKTTGWKKKDEK